MFFKIIFPLAPVEMQQATHSRLHVRDARDAHTVFEAVRQGFLRPVTRRLNEMERSLHVHSGAIFVWEECEDESGLKRWTDGRVWGQSRMREPYLFYDEKLGSDNIAKDMEQRSPTFRFVDGVARGNSHSSSALLHQDRSGGQHPGLVKQAYSAWVVLSPNSKPRKWHLTAYFTYADLSSIPTVERDPILRKIIVPQGIYRGGKARSRNEEESGAAALIPEDYHIRGGAFLPPLHSTVGSYLGNGLAPRLQVQRARSENDQRLITMLNSRYI
ncbi:Gti1/Pac2 family-domain-containing protein [Mycena floridula]|nr:Gti1/Pac2 family-domain-containing protein [Mycena floridula]